jgi:hypothetical protein
MRSARHRGRSAANRPPTSVDAPPGASARISGDRSASATSLQPIACPNLAPARPLRHASSHSARPVARPMHRDDVQRMRSTRRAREPDEAVALIVVGGQRRRATARRQPRVHPPPPVQTSKSASRFHRSSGRRPSRAPQCGPEPCSSALCPSAPHPHLERGYLVVPACAHRGWWTSTRIRTPPSQNVIEPDDPARKAGYSRPHTSHCGPEGIYMNALGNPEGDAPGGIFRLDGESLDAKGA